MEVIQEVHNSLILLNHKTHHGNQYNGKLRILYNGGYRQGRVATPRVRPLNVSKK
jgi:hypothetical protein